jgi:hypothetical protein
MARGLYRFFFIDGMASQKAAHGLNDNHLPVVVWKVKNTFPAQLEWSKLHATEEEILIETLETAHEGMVVEQG